MPASVEAHPSWSPMARRLAGLPCRRRFQTLKDLDAAHRMTLPRSLNSGDWSPGARRARHHGCAPHPQPGPPDGYTLDGGLAELDEMRKKLQDLIRERDGFPITS